MKCQTVEETRREKDTRRAMKPDIILSGTMKTEEIMKPEGIMNTEGTKRPSNNKVMPIEEESSQECVASGEKPPAIGLARSWSLKLLSGYGLGS